MPIHAAILVTGMSGVGKSTALSELAQRGFVTVDTDEGDWIHVVDGEPLWRETLVDDLLNRPRETTLFVQTVLKRLESRTNNPFGKTQSERAQIAEDIENVEPLLRQAATYEIDTTLPLAEVVDELARIAREVSPN